MEPVRPEDDETPLQSIVEHVQQSMDGESYVDLKTVVEGFGNRSFGPVMILCGLCMMTPLGAIPGLPAAFGLIVIVFALQLLFRRPTPWMPEVLRRVKIPASKLKVVQEKTRPVLAAIDNVIRPRLLWAATGPMQVLAALMAIVLSATFVPLGAVPFGVVPSAFIVGLLGLGITARDGVVILFAMSLGVGALAGTSMLVVKLLAGSPLG
jgi:hypothetical protein